AAAQPSDRGPWSACPDPRAPVGPGPPWFPNSCLGTCSLRNSVSLLNLCGDRNGSFAKRAFPNRSSGTRGRGEEFGNERTRGGVWEREDERTKLRAALGAKVLEKAIARLDRAGLRYEVVAQDVRLLSVSRGDRTC